MDKFSTWSLFITWCILFSLLAVLLYTWIQGRKSHFSIFKDIGIPNPEPNILLGNAWEFYRKGYVNVFREWHEKYGPVVGISMGYKPMMLVSDVELFKIVFIRDLADFTDRDQIQGSRLHSKSLLGARESS